MSSQTRSWNSGGSKGWGLGEGWGWGGWGPGASPLPTYFWTKARPTAGARALAGSSIILSLNSQVPTHPTPERTPLSQPWWVENGHTYDWRNGSEAPPLASYVLWLRHLTLLRVIILQLSRQINWAAWCLGSMQVTSIEFLPQWDKSSPLRIKPYTCMQWSVGYCNLTQCQSVKDSRFYFLSNSMSEKPKPVRPHCPTLVVKSFFPQLLSSHSH